MERLVYSSSSTLLKTHLKNSPLLPRPSKLESLKLTRPEFRRVNSVSCKHENPSASFVKFPSLIPLQVDSLTWSTSKTNLVKLIVDGVSVKSKTATVGIFMVVSAIILIHPVFALPAFATFQTAAKTGGLLRSGQNLCELNY